MSKSGPGNCSVCSSKHRASIELGLVRGISFNALSKRFECSADSIGRHSENHLSPVQRAALLTATQPTAIDLDQLHEQEGAGLLANLVAQRARLQVLAEAAADAGDINGAVTAEGGVGRNLALTGKLLGLIIQKHAVTHTNLLISPDYLRLRQVLVTTLRAFPDAALAVSRALHALEADAAKDITDKAAKRKPHPAPALIEHEPAREARPEPLDVTPAAPDIGIPMAPAALPPCPVGPPC